MQRAQDINSDLSQERVMKHFPHILLVAIVALVSIVALAFLYNAHPSGPKPGDIVRADVVITGASDLGGIQVSLGYNPDVLMYDHATEGPLLKAEGAQTLFLDVIKQEPGLVKDVAIVRMGPGVSESGTVASVYFTVKKKGSADVSLASVLLSDSKGNALSPALASLQVVTE
jgi:hypothetical protein